jgi:hypothetical protein
MKLKTTSLAAIVALAITGSASAAVLLTDNFNTANNDVSTFNNTLAADQGGTLATISYTATASPSGGWSAQHSNAGHFLLCTTTLGGATASLNHNFATNANGVGGGALSVSIAGWWASDNNADEADDWFSISIGSGQNTLGNSASGVGYGVEFAFDGSTKIFTNGATIGSTAAATWSADRNVAQNITITLSNGSGGSAFNGTGSVAELYSGTTLISSITLSQLTGSDGFISFAAQNGDNKIQAVYFDDLNVSTIPEPHAALLGGLGILALLRRRR